MSREFWDHHDEGRDQPELEFTGIQRASEAGEERPAPAAPPREAARPERNGDPARSAFFRAKRRPVLPVLGVVGAIATVALFAWLGSDEAPELDALEFDELAPVASAPDFELPFPEAADGPPAASSLAAEAPLAALEPATLPAEVAAIAEPEPPTAPKPAPASAPAAARDAFAVQLLAARSEADVGASWETLLQAHPDLLTSLSPTVSRLDRGPGDTFYRLRAGPLRDRGAAEALCKALSARQQSCFVVSPGS